MIKHFCDLCSKEMPWHDSQPRRIIGKVDDVSVWFAICVTDYGGDVECCDPCFNRWFEVAFDSHMQEVNRLRSQKAEEYSVPDA
jgi:hypothetical protein